MRLKSGIAPLEYFQAIQVFSALCYQAAAARDGRA